MSAKKLPDLSTLIWLRRSLTLKEIAAMYECAPSTVCKYVQRAEALMAETKRLGWIAWEEKKRAGGVDR